jgi:hypothetical protein
MFVDQQQGLQRAADVAVAPGHNLVDRGIIRFRKQLNPPIVPQDNLRN